MAAGWRLQFLTPWASPSGCHDVAAGLPLNKWSEREREAELATHRRYSLLQPNPRGGTGSPPPYRMGHTELPWHNMVGGGGGGDYTRMGPRSGTLGSSWRLYQDLKLNLSQMEFLKSLPLHTNFFPPPFLPSCIAINSEPIFPFARAKPLETSLTPLWPSHSWPTLQQILAAVPSKYIKILTSVHHPHRYYPGRRPLV